MFEPKKAVTLAPYNVWLTIYTLPNGSCVFRQFIDKTTGLIVDAEDVGVITSADEHNLDCLVSSLAWGFVESGTEVNLADYVCNYQVMTRTNLWGASTSSWLSTPEQVDVVVADAIANNLQVTVDANSLLDCSKWNLHQHTGNAVSEEPVPNMGDL